MTATSPEKANMLPPFGEAALMPESGERGETTAQARPTFDRGTRRSLPRAPRLSDGVLIDDWIGYGTYIDPERKIVYMETPKVACTSIKYFLRELLGLAPIGSIPGILESRRDMFIHHRDENPMRTLSSFPKDQWEKLLRGDNWFRFCVKRHPFERFFSAWRDKVFLCEPGHTFEKYLRSPTDQFVEFTDFFERVIAEEDPFTCNPHWRAQVALLFPQDIAYTRVYDIQNIGNLRTDLAQHLSALGRGGSLPELQRLNQGYDLSIADFITPRVAKELEQFYEADFTFFEFPAFNQFAKTTKMGVEVTSSFTKAIFERNRLLTDITETDEAERKNWQREKGELKKENAQAQQELAKVVAEREKLVSELGQARRDLIDRPKDANEPHKSLANAAAELAHLRANLDRRYKTFSYKVFHIPREIGRQVRKPFHRLAFHKSGKPRGWIRKSLFHSNGRVRGVFRHWVYDANGRARSAFKMWLLESGRKSHSAPASVALASLLTGAPKEPALAAVESAGAILVAADFPPLYDQHSGGLRLKTLIEMFGKLQRPIIFASKFQRTGLPGVLGTDEGRIHYEDVLRKAGVVEFTYGADELDAFLGGQSRDFRYAFLAFPAVAETFLPIVRQHCPEAKVIYDMVDFHALRMEREAALKGCAKLADDAAAMKRREISLCKAADITIAISADEKKTLLELAPTAVIEILPNVFEIPAKAPPGPEGRRDVLFLGGFWHRPNGDAAKWFVEHIWPRVSAMAPDSRFLIAGSNPGADVLALGRTEGVEVLGYVANLELLYNSARVCVAPLRFGAGVKGKVGQSMAYGLPVVATSIGAEGMCLQDGEHLLIGDDPNVFAQHVIALMQDDRLWIKMQAKAREFVEAQFSVRALTEKVEHLFHA